MLHWSSFRLKIPHGSQEQEIEFAGVQSKSCVCIRIAYRYNVFSCKDKVKVVFNARFWATSHDAKFGNNVNLTMWPIERSAVISQG